MYFDNNTIIGNRIKIYRGLKGLRQEDLADKIGLSNTQMSNLECGRNNLSFKTLQKICEVLDICPCVLLTGAIKSNIPDNIIDIIKHLTPKEQETLYLLLLSYIGDKNSDNI